MKAKLITFNTFVLLLLAASVMAQKTTTTTVVTTNSKSVIINTDKQNKTSITKITGGVVKEKLFSKTYPLRAGKQVNIKNKYGDISLKSWDRDEVKVDVAITAFSVDDKTANEVLDKINIESKDGNSVNFTTEIQGNISNGKRNTSFEINYMVYMPSQNPISIKNEFGGTSMPDWNGDVNIDQSYGDIVTGELAKGKDIEVSFGGLKSKAIHDGDLNISYSNFIVDKLSGIIDAKIDFCGTTKIGLQSNLEKLNLRASYSEIMLQIAPALNALIDINTSYGEVVNRSKLQLVDETKYNKYGPTFNKIYSIKVGTGKNSANITSSFGNVTLK